MEIHKTNKIYIYIKAGKKTYLSNKQRLLYLTSKGRKQREGKHTRKKKIKTYFLALELRKQTIMLLPCVMALV